MKTGFTTGAALRFTTAALLYGSLTMQAALAVEVAKPRLTYQQFQQLQQQKAVAVRDVSYWLEKRISEGLKPA